MQNLNFLSKMLVTYAHLGANNAHYDMMLHIQAPVAGSLFWTLWVDTHAVIGR